jgi:ubiquinone/menaquinone biosynthesis C-methylase UbiE
MNTGFEFDEAAARQVEKVYLTPDVAAQRRAVLEALDLGPGERVLDIGSGPGLLAFEMAAAVGPEGRVCGVDLSEDMLSLARARCAAWPWVAFESADATRLPYSEGAFDAAVSTQVYEYVPDVPAALAELHRVLRPGGRALILDTDYGSFVWHTEDRARMARVLAAWDEHFVHPDLPRVLSPRLREAGFTVVRREVVPMFNPELHEDTFSSGMIGLIAGFVPGRNGVTEAEAAA